MKKIGSHIMASGLFLCSLFGLWIVGIMPAISLIIGAISLLGFAAAIGYIQTPVIRKGTYWFYGTMVLFIALNTIYSLIPTQIKEELQANKKVETIKMAEHLHPSGSGTVEIIRDVCKEEYEKNLQGILERYKSSTDANRSERMIEQIQGLEAQRKKCGEAVITITANNPTHSSMSQETKVVKESVEEIQKTTTIVPYKQERTNEDQEEEPTKTEIASDINAFTAPHKQGLEKQILAAERQGWVFYKESTQEDHNDIIWKKDIFYFSSRGENYYEKITTLYFGQQVLRQYRTLDSWGYGDCCKGGLVQVEKDGKWYAGKGEFLQIRVTNSILRFSNGLSRKNPESVLFILQDESGKEVMRREVHSESHQQQENEEVAKEQPVKQKVEAPVHKKAKK